MIAYLNFLKKLIISFGVIEDDKRLCEKNSDFGDEFIKLSRDVHFLNDERAKIKLEINNHTGSKIKEIKSGVFVQCGVFKGWTLVPALLYCEKYNYDIFAGVRGDPPKNLSYRLWKKYPENF